MPFVRHPADRWHHEVPGARWFKADLHVHTLDDHPCGRIKMPDGLGGEDMASPDVLRRYARAMLQGAVRAGIEVLGLAPHATRVGVGPETSAVWAIVDTWNDDDDDDGIPFRNKIYAVFPGFEPNINDGSKGVHLIFLFDPEIGRDAFLRLFDAVMDGRHPWAQGSLRMTTKDARAVLATVDSVQGESIRNREASWDFVVLAPHSDGEHGLFKAVQSQVLENFPCERLAGYELQKGKLPEDFFDQAARRHQSAYIRAHGQAFFHATDAYRCHNSGDQGEFDIGHRFTWLKLASPRIEAIRQAFLANDSRLRIAYRRDPAGQLVLRADPPDAVPTGRPWIRTVTVAGGASFFGGQTEQGPRTTTFALNPDLTCIIGGSMSGKSTLLDGLRLHLGATLPADPTLRKQVESRGANLSVGHAKITLDEVALPTNPGTPRFFTQGELQRLSGDAGAIEALLLRFEPEVQAEVLMRRHIIEETRQAARERVTHAQRALDELERASQDLKASEDAKAALEAFASAGLEQLTQCENAVNEHARLLATLDEMGAASEAFWVAFKRLDDFGIGSKGYDAILRERFSRWEIGRGMMEIREKQRATDHATLEFSRNADDFDKVLKGRRDQLRQQVEGRLVEMGHTASKLREFDALQKTASRVESYRSVVDRALDRRRSLRVEIDEAIAAIRNDTSLIRAIIDGIIDSLHSANGGRIRISRVEGGRSEPLDEFLKGLKNKGVTQWWNGRPKDKPLTPEALLKALAEGDAALSRLGMSAVVAEAFRSAMVPTKRDELALLESEDRYDIEVLVDERSGEYRPLDELSGGKRVNVLLTLLLEAHDDSPLVIDQPEDELDNRFLFETVLPALRRLKGRRQVIVATHNANIVVNGDADLVIQLEADAKQGHVGCAGAIEDEAVKLAVVETVDGGRQAFDLRKAKYGF